MALASSLTQSDIWKLLQQHHADIAQEHMLDWFANDPNRFESFHVEAAGLSLDYSKNRVTRDTMQWLIRLAEERDVPAKTRAMFRGEAINRSENRPALHTALRNFSDRPIMVDGGTTHA